MKQKPLRVTPDGREAPRLHVVYACPKCCEHGYREVTLDAYYGPPTCKGQAGCPAHAATFMDAVRLDYSKEK